MRHYRTLKVELQFPVSDRWPNSVESVPDFVNKGEHHVLIQTVYINIAVLIVLSSFYHTLVYCQ